MIVLKQVLSPVDIVYRLLSLWWWSGVLCKCSTNILVITGLVVVVSVLCTWCMFLIC